MERESTTPCLQHRRIIILSVLLACSILFNVSARSLGGVPSETPPEKLTTDSAYAESVILFVPAGVSKTLLKSD